MQFVVVICIFIQEHLPSDLLIAEQCQMTALLLLLVSLKVSDWDVQEMGRVKLGSSPGKSSQWCCRKKPSHLTQNQGVHMSIFISWSGAERIRRDEQQPKCCPGSGSGFHERENLLVVQARACETHLAQMRLGFGHCHGAYKTRGLHLFPDGWSAV